MTFSDKMRDSLGAEGARIDVVPPDGAVAPGSSADVKVTIVGGSATATVDALTVRLIEATRHWVAEDGTVVAEADAPDRDARKGMTAGWTRTPLGEQRVAVDHTLEPGQSHEVTVALSVPEGCAASTVACNHTINVQADIKGQIDPTGNARLTVG